MSCLVCHLSTSAPRNFLLKCCKCSSFYHHRCHLPPVSDPELISRIRAHNTHDSSKGLAAWTCAQCLQIPKPVIDLTIPSPAATPKNTPFLPESKDPSGTSPSSGGLRPLKSNSGPLSNTSLPNHALLSNVLQSEESGGGVRPHDDVRQIPNPCSNYQEQCPIGVIDNMPPGFASQTVSLHPATPPPRARFPTLATPTPTLELREEAEDVLEYASDSGAVTLNSDRGLARRNPLFIPLLSTFDDSGTETEFTPERQTLSLCSTKSASESVQSKSTLRRGKSPIVSNHGPCIRQSRSMTNVQSANPPPGLVPAAIRARHFTADSSGTADSWARKAARRSTTQKTQPRTRELRTDLLHMFDATQWFRERQK